SDSVHFFFHLSVAHRDFHSFPTRRSSDLSSNKITRTAMGPRQKFLELPFIKLCRGRRRGRLVRHYFATSLILIGGGLIVSGLVRSEGHTSELQSLTNIVCRLLLERNTHPS